MSRVNCRSVRCTTEYYGGVVDLQRVARLVRLAWWVAQAPDKFTIPHIADLPACDVIAHVVG